MTSRFVFIKNYARRIAFIFPFKNQVNLLFIFQLVIKAAEKLKAD